MVVEMEEQGVVEAEEVILQHLILLLLVKLEQIILEAVVVQLLIQVDQVEQEDQE
tara:strand:+ start:323 stop:487 length:165 start_codon:yes stop_codon:yes gene_type:complete